MGRAPFPAGRKLFREALILFALLILLFPPSSLGSAFSRVSAGILLIAAGFFFYLGAGELLSGLSLSRRLVLCFFAVILLWGLTGFAGAGSDPGRAGGAGFRGDRVWDLGQRIDRVAEVGGAQVKTFLDSTFTSGTGQFLGTLGEVTGSAAGVLIDAVLTSTSTDTSMGHQPEGPREGSPPESPFSMVPLARLGILAVSLFLLAAIRGFVYIDRSPFVVWLYRFTTALAFLTAILHIAGLRVIISSGTELFAGIEVELSSLLLLLFSVSLGFCQRWVQYLSRRSRYILLPAALITVMIMRNIYFHLAESPQGVMGGLDLMAVTVLAVYILFAFITMVLQLPTARILEKRGRELATLQDLSQALHSSFEPDQLGMASVRLGVKLTGADACWFHLNTGEEHIHERTGDWSGLSERLGARWYRGVDQRIDATGHGFMINNYRRSTLRKLEEGDACRTRIASLVAAPVEVRGERLGVIVAASSRQFFFLDYTRGLFDSFTRQIAQAIQSARLFGEKLHRQSLERELALAREIQKSLLPGHIHQPAGWEIEAVSIPSRVMGGDYYDVIRMNGDEMAIAVADVSGKGAAAAMLMAALQASLGTLLRENLPVADTVSRLNRALCDRMPDDTFITFFLAFINTKTGGIRYCCAGHDPPMLCRNGGNGPVENLHLGGLVLGVVPDADYEMGEVVIHTGERLLLYTDGITETMTPEEEPFGVKRLETFLLKHCEESAERIIVTITGLLEKFRGDCDQQDDVTALVLVRKPIGEEQCRNTVQ